MFIFLHIYLITCNTLGGSDVVNKFPVAYLFTLSLVLINQHVIFVDYLM